MNTSDIQYFKEKLLAEKKRLEAALGEVGQKNPQNPNDWQPTATDIEIDTADENEVADKLEEFDGNTGIIDKLEKQLCDVNSALERIDNSTYGKCEICGDPIEKERLEANPSSKISIKHGHESVPTK